MTLDVVTLGETMVLLLPAFGESVEEAAAFRCHVAGSETTVVIGLARLGRSTGWISRLGRDAFGQRVLRRVRGEGVDTRHVRLVNNRATGLLVRNWGSAKIEVQYYRRGSAASTLSPEDIDEEYVTSARLLYVTGITPALSESARQATFTAVEIANSAGVPVAFDPNLRTKLWSPLEAKPVLRDLATRTQLLFAGAEEAALLVDESHPPTAAAALRMLGLRVVVIKEGSDGAYVSSDREEVIRPACRVTLIDPVGAGDAFAAGFLAAWLDELPLETCLAWGNANGAACVASKGDVEGLLRLEQLVAYHGGEDVQR